MTTVQIQWGVITLMFAVILFFIKNLVSTTNKEMDKISTEVDKKVAENACKERHADTKALFKHKHAEPGGEVIIK